MSRKRRRRGNRDPERQDRGLVTGRGRARANEMGRAALLCGCAGTQPALCAGDSPHFPISQNRSFQKMKWQSRVIAYARQSVKKNTTQKTGLSFYARSASTSTSPKSPGRRTDMTTWPFPSNIMIGFRAEYASGELPLPAKSWRRGGDSNPR